MKILFVCLGNICRSPTAHAVMRQKVRHLTRWQIESAGTSASHRGEKPDARSRREGEARGYTFEGIFSRPVKDTDFADYDLLLAMDEANLAELQRRCPPEHKHKLSLFLRFHPDYPSLSEVPDPYYGGRGGFTLVLDLIEQGCEAILQQLNRDNAS